MKIIAISIIVLGQLVCLGTILSSCSQKSSSAYGSNHIYYKKDLKKIVLGSSVNKCSKLSR